jgi:hypothetical protein
MGFEGVSPFAEVVGSGGPFELYSNYPLQIQAVAASVNARPKMDGEGPDLSDRASASGATEVDLLND